MNTTILFLEQQKYLLVSNAIYIRNIKKYKFYVSNHVSTSKYKNAFATSYQTKWAEEVLVIQIKIH